MHDGVRPYPETKQSENSSVSWMVGACIE